MFSFVKNNKTQKLLSLKISEKIRRQFFSLTVNITMVDFGRLSGGTPNSAPAGKQTGN